MELRKYFCILIEQLFLSIVQLKIRHATHKESKNLCGIFLLRVICETVSAFLTFLTNPFFPLYRKYILLVLQFQLMIYV